MKYMTRIIGLCLAVIIAIASNAAAVVAANEPTKRVLIAEVSPEAKDSASKEFIVLYNPNAIQVDVAGWSLQYRSASHKSEDSSGWMTKAIIGCQSTKQTDCANFSAATIAPGETLRLSSFETGDGIAPLASGMATTGGEVRLIRPETDGQEPIQDMVGYGNAADYEGKAAPAPKAGQSIVRSQDETGAFVDTDHNDADFVLSPDENNDTPPPADQPDAGTTDPGKGAGDPPAVYRAAEITEVLPDPASPQLDSADEFIELYNPYAEELDLTGYVLKTGTDWTHKYTISNVVIDSYGYVALTSAQTHLSLSNTGSGVRLYDPAGNLIAEAPSYGKAQTGSSWVKGADGQWAWTAKPTPGEQNIIETPPPAQSGTTKKTTTASSSSTKKAAAKTASAPKKASTSKAATAAVKGAATTAQPAGTAEGNQIGMWALAGAGTLGAGYALYEYRQEISGFMRRRWEAVASFAGKR